VRGRIGLAHARGLTSNVARRYITSSYNVILAPSSTLSSSFSGYVLAVGGPLGILRGGRVERSLPTAVVGWGSRWPFACSPRSSSRFLLGFGTLLTQMIVPRNQVAASHDLPVGQRRHVCMSPRLGAKCWSYGASPAFVVGQTDQRGTTNGKTRKGLETWLEPRWGAPYAGNSRSPCWFGAPLRARLARQKVGIYV